VLHPVIVLQAESGKTHAGSAVDTIAVDTTADTTAVTDAVMDSAAGITDSTTDEVADAVADITNSTVDDFIDPTAANTTDPTVADTTGTTVDDFTGTDTGTDTGYTGRTTGWHNWIGKYKFAGATDWWLQGMYEADADKDGEVTLSEAVSAAESIGAVMS